MNKLNYTGVRHLKLFVLLAFLQAFSFASAQLSITCPSDISEINDPGVCSAVVSYSPPSGSGSGTGITVTLTSGLPSGSAFPVGTNTVTYTVTNNEGDSESCSFNVVVNDVEDPIFDCPDDILVDADPGACIATVNFSIPDVTDNCGVNTITQIGGLPSGSAFPVGENNIDFQAQDAAGNSAFCRFQIIVADITDPTISCPDNISVGVFNSCDTTITYTPPVGTDACTTPTTTQTSGLGSGSSFPVGTTIEEYTVTDEDGNTATCSFSVTVSDAAPPEIICPGDITVNAAPNDCDAIVSFADATATDNCPGAIDITQTDGPLSGGAFPVGTTSVEFTAIDLAGNSSTCSFNVTVEENILPEIDCPEDIAVDTDAGSCDAVVVYTPPNGTDNCPGATTTLTSGLGSGSVFPVGTTTETYTVTDASGNEAMCSFNITVLDEESPIIDCPADISVASDAGECNAVVNFADATATDNCPGVTVTQTSGPTSGSDFPVGDTTVEFTAEDAAGNIGTCSFTVTVEDNEDPVITCPADVSVSISGGNCTTTLTYPDPTVTDNCPGAGFTVVSGPESGDEVTAGDYVVELEATDAAGNTTTCSFNVSIEETSIPVFDCPEDLTVPADAGVCEAVISFSAPTASDSCSTVTVNQTGGPVSGSTFPAGSTVVEFTAEDEFGNTATCSFNIIVEDQEAPMLSCPSNVTVPAEPGECNAVVNFADATATDNCPGVTVTQTGGPSSGSAFPVGDTTVAFTAEDAAGNIETCSFTVTVEDNEDPVITCPADVSVSIPGGNCTTTLTYTNPTVTDNCPGAGFTVISGPESGDEVTAGDYVVELEATDAAGNTATCSFNVSIEETSIPVFDCPDDLTVPADAGSCEAVVTFSAPTASDSCSTVIVTQTAGPSSGSTFPAGSTAIEFTAEDEFGNTETCSFNIVVEDDTAPEITCPDDIITANDAGICGSTVNYVVPTGSDNCGIASVVQIEGLGPGSEFPVGITTETYVVTDVSGNTDTCAFTITVVDEENPQITCPTDILEVLPDGDCEAVVTYSLPVATDNCGIESLDLISGLPSGSAFPTGENTVTYEATDAAGNTVACSFTVTVQENVDPTIDCPADIIMTADADLCGATVTYAVPEGIDDCPGAITEQIAGLGSGSFFPVGTTTETYEVTDASGNQVSCSFTVTITDDQDPVLACPGDIALSSDPGDCEAVVVFDMPSVTDNCDDGLTPVQTAGPVSGSAFPVGSTEVSFEATDLSGNTTTCSFDITVEDNELPEITCPDDIVVDAASGDCDVTVNYPAPVATDNCPGVAVTLSEGLPSGTSFPIGTTTITYQATDVAGNIALCSFTVTVSEDVPPEITCPDDIIINNDPGACGAVVTYDAPVASDNCGMVEVSLTSGLESGALFPVGITTVTFTATDISGNETSCSFDVEIIDNEAPVTVCPDDITLSAAADNCGQVYDFGEPDATDNCTDFPEIIQTAGPVSGTLLPLGSTTFEFEITDDFGNTAVCEYTVTVVDDLAPVFSECPENFDVFTNDESCESEVSFDLPIATDNCEVTIVQTEGPANGAILAVGTHSYVFTATDDAGNASQCSFQVSVIDTVPPALSCPESFETCESIVDFDPPAATDNCDIESILQIEGPTSGTDFPVGENAVTFEATDVNGNTSTCTFVVTVLQNAPRADAGGDQNICEETETTLQGNNPGEGSGLWTLLSGSGEISSPGTPATGVTDLEPGENTFIWSIDPENGCAIESDTVTVVVEQNVNVEAGDDQIIFAGSSTVINAIFQPTGGDIIWEPEAGLSCITCSSPVASPEETTLYFITYTTALGCEKTDSVTVRVFEELPNTITPDGDGTNDVWNIPNIEDYPNVGVVIYNRWGNTIFESSGYDEPWDGTQDGKSLPTGSYYYIIDYNVEGKENLNGTVNIIR